MSPENVCFDHCIIRIRQLEREVIELKIMLENHMKCGDYCPHTGKRG